MVNKDRIHVKEDDVFITQRESVCKADDLAPCDGAFFVCRDVHTQAEERFFECLSCDSGIRPDETVIVTVSTCVRSVYGGRDDEWPFEKVDLA